MEAPHTRIQGQGAGGVAPWLLRGRTVPVTSEFLGRGRVLSFVAPDHCDRCDHDEARLIRAAALAPKADTFAAPSFRCPRCASVLGFDRVLQT